MSVALRFKRQLKGLKMGSQHLPSFTFYAILDPLVRPSQSIVGCTDLKVERTGACVRACVCVRACMCDPFCQITLYFLHFSAII